MRLVMGWTWAAELGLTLWAVVAVSTVARPGPHVNIERGSCNMLGVHKGSKHTESTQHLFILLRHDDEHKQKLVETVGPV